MGKTYKQNNRHFPKNGKDYRKDKKPKFNDGKKWKSNEIKSPTDFYVDLQEP